MMTLLDILGSLTQQSGRLLYSEVVADNLIQVRQKGRFRWLNFGDQPLQSLMDTEDPQRLIFPYTEAMMGVFLFVPESVNALNLGFGGGCIERYLKVVKPALALTSIERNSKVVEIAKAYFFIEENRVVHVESAARYLERCQDRYSIVFCDIFEPGGPPACLKDPIFYDRISLLLEETGVAVFNCLNREDGELLDILLPLRIFFRYVFLLDFPGLHNVLLFALKRLPASINELEERAESFLAETGTDLRWMPSHLTLLPPSNAQ